ncbi:DEAD/DEAH box helicase, partial [bacterium]|nr:DEAD/DEAH box helicase [bacterium]
MQFTDLQLIEPLMRAVGAEGYDTPTPIQQKAIPHVLEGRDLIGVAQTGTGKTAAFALPVLQRLHGGSTSVNRRYRPVRALVLTPTRELALQVGESFATYGQNTKLKHTTVYGGVKQSRQVNALKRGVDIVAATPGRLLDLLNQNIFDLRAVEVFILDEADRMLDMGFLPDIRRIIKQLPTDRQTLLFSATMPAEIEELADTILQDPVSVSAAPTRSAAADTVEQSLYFIHPSSKTRLLQELLRDPAVTRALVFARTKRRADRVTKQLCARGISTAAIHSDKSQGARQKALEDFKRGVTRVLVASDIAARGLDVDDISHVFNYDLPDETETYVHRIGRTGRAGATGQAITFCIQEQRKDLQAIERLIGRAIPVLEHAIPRSAASHKPYHAAKPHAARPKSAGSRNGDSPRPKRADSRDGNSSRPKAAAPRTGKPARREDDGQRNGNSFRPKNGAPRSAKPDSRDASNRWQGSPTHKGPKSGPSRDGRPSHPKAAAPRNGSSSRPKSGTARSAKPESRDPNSRWQGSTDYKP